MKKIIVTIFAFTIMFLCGGCEKKAEYEFLHDLSEISTIEIVKIGEAIEGEEIIPMTSTCVVTNKDDFLIEFLEMSCYSAWGDPQSVREEATVIKIIYNNEEFELIDVGGQSEYTHERGYRHYAGYRYFDENQFEKLLSKYCSE